MMNFFSRLSILILLTYHGAVIGQECTKEEFEECTKPFNELNLRRSLIFPDYLVNIDDHCRVYDEHVGSCMGEILNQCDGSHNYISYSIYLTFKYICNQTMNDFKTYRSCITSGNLQAEANKCNFGVKLTPSSTDQEICDAAIQDLECVKGTVTKYCGSEAAHWVTRLKTLSSVSLLEDIKCNYLEQELKFHVENGGIHGRSQVAVLMLLCVLWSLVYF